jgi:hypothetical protein
VTVQAATLEMNPSIAAPGSAVHTATASDLFSDVDGTSYSAPFVSGEQLLLRAILLQQHVGTLCHCKGLRV